MRKHLVLDVHFVRGVPSKDAPTTCTCGWKGRAFDFNVHRKAEGCCTEYKVGLSKWTSGSSAAELRGVIRRGWRA